MDNKKNNNKINYKLLLFLLILAIIGSMIVAFFNNIYGWLVILFSMIGILKDWKELWALIKSYVVSDANNSPTQYQHSENSRDSYQAAGDININHWPKRNKK